MMVINITAATINNHRVNLRCARSLWISDSVVIGKPRSTFSVMIGLSHHVVDNGERPVRALNSLDLVRGNLASRKSGSMADHCATDIPRQCFQVGVAIHHCTVAYHRIADSHTNIISNLLPSFVLESALELSQQSGDPSFCHAARLLALCNPTHDHTIAEGSDVGSHSSLSLFH